MNNKPIINIENLSFSYSKSNQILNNISISIDKKDLIAVIGPNGSGKSTFVKIIAGLNKPNKGKVKVNGKIAYVPQKYSQDNNFPAKVSEILALECCDCSNREEIIKSLNIKEFSNKQFKDLSGGQQQRVMIALSLLSNPDIIILDEPSVGVDIQTQKEFYKLLKELNDKDDLTILFVTHDTEMVSSYFDKIICFHERHIHLDNAKNTTKALNQMYGKEFNKVVHEHTHKGDKK